MVYPIVIYGHPLLKKVAEDIDKNYPDLDKFIGEMFETMYASEGLGLAAPQVGRSIRLFVIDGEPAAEDDPTMAGFKKTFINAKITERTGEPVIMGEGCLSIPNMREDVSREPKIRIEYYDENWAFHSEEYEGYKARVIQHEYDHIDGILYVDRVSALKKRLIKGKLNAIMKGKFEADYRVILAGQKIK